MKYNKIIKGISKHIINSYNKKRDDRFWPSDYRIFISNPFNLAYGVSGVLYFLDEIGIDIQKEYSKLLFSEKIDKFHLPPGLYIGLSGVAWVLLKFRYIKRAKKIICEANKSNLRFEISDIFYGEAGLGLTNLYFYLLLKDEKYLKEAIKCGEYIYKCKKKFKDTYYWSDNKKNNVYLGYARGNSGIAIFMLYLFLLTKKKKYLLVGKKALDFELLNKTIIKRDSKETYSFGEYANVLRKEKNSIVYPYWKFGSSGVGLVLIRYYYYLKDDKYLKLAKKCARDSMIDMAMFPSYFKGLAGIGDFLYDMYQYTNNKIYLNYCHDIAETIYLFRIENSNDEIAFPAEFLYRISCDYGTGASGIGIFYNRLSTNTNRAFLLDPYIKVK